MCVGGCGVNPCLRAPGPEVSRPCPPVGRCSRVCKRGRGLGGGRGWGELAEVGGVRGRMPAVRCRDVCAGGMAAPPGSGQPPPPQP